ncbi:AsmA family protein [Halomonas ramblicola]|uniref:AsmA family protein n=1 Tax=Halomonas ramblicola TaxID=747349 RepID=UPI0025B58323|nr:AsmA family protein [Halomonas ramblicola]MDN3521219.1 AsmA family protein [Halomonas ramblicola]
MKRLLSALLAVIGVLAVLAVGAVVYVTTFFDPEDLKPRLVEVVREQSGLELALEGPLTWSFYPRLGVGVEQADAWLPDQEPGEEASFMAFRRAEVSLSFAPLLRGEIAIDGMTLDGLRLNLERDAEGRGNWESLLERLAEGSTGAEEVLAPAGASTGPLPSGEGGLAVALNIASVQVRDGELNYRDLGADQALRLEELSITGRNVNPRRAFPLEASFRLISHDDPDVIDEATPRLASDVTLDGRVALELAERRYLMEDLTLSSSSRLDGGENAQGLDLSGARLVVDMHEGRLLLDEGNLEADLQHPALGDSPLALALDFALEADLAAESAQLRDLELTGDDGLRLSGNLNLHGLSAAPTYDGQLRLAPLSLRPWLERFDRLPATADAEALSDVALTSPLEGDLDGVELTGLTLVLDDSTFTGRLAAGLDGRRLEADLQGDGLDLDAYLPPREASANGEDSAALGVPGIASAHAQEPAPLVPVEWLAELGLDARLTLGSLTLAGLDFTDLTLALDGGDGRQRLTSLESAFYEGDLAASGELDLTRDPVAWQLAPRLDRVRTDSLFEALGEESAPLRGRLSAEGELTSRGNTWPALKRHLNGNFASRLDDGAILDVNVSKELCTAVASLEGEETSRDWAPDTRFDRAEASFVVRDGTLESDDLIATLPGMELGGEGWLDLTSERFDLRAAARVVDTADLACNVNPRLERVPFPVRCEGSLGGDSGEWCRFDRAAFQETLGGLLSEELGRRAGEELEGALEDLDERIGDEAGEELRDSLRGLFD